MAIVLVPGSWGRGDKAGVKSWGLPNPLPMHPLVRFPWRSLPRDHPPLGKLNLHGAPTGSELGTFSNPALQISLVTDIMRRWEGHRQEVESVEPGLFSLISNGVAEVPPCLQLQLTSSSAGRQLGSCSCYCSPWWGIF